MHTPSFRQGHCRGVVRGSMDVESLESGNESVSRLAEVDVPVVSLSVVATTGSVVTVIAVACVDVES